MIDNMQFLILAALATLITLSIHEFAHALAAYKLGDNTAKYAGRLTINPLKHLDPIGALCMIFFHFGWAKPVPINPRNFKNPKKRLCYIRIRRTAGKSNHCIFYRIPISSHFCTFKRR